MYEREIANFFPCVWCQNFTCRVCRASIVEGQGRGYPIALRLGGVSGLVRPHVAVDCIHGTLVTALGPPLLLRTIRRSTFQLRVRLDDSRGLGLKSSFVFQISTTILHCQHRSDFEATLPLSIPSTMTHPTTANSFYSDSSSSPMLSCAVGV